ncbi:unnamed protein product, partial [Laminaria digitata]
VLAVFLGECCNIGKAKLASPNSAHIEGAHISTAACTRAAEGAARSVITTAATGAAINATNRRQSTSMSNINQSTTRADEVSMEYTSMELAVDEKGGALQYPPRRIV